MSTATRSVKVGDMVTVKGCFGMAAPQGVRVTGMEVTEFPRGKYGTPADEVSHGMIEQNRVLFTLDNGHWCYSSQVVLGGAA